MLTIMTLVVLAVNGGLFTGTILYSAWRAAQFEQTIGIAEKLGSLLQASW